MRAYEFDSAVARREMRRIGYATMAELACASGVSASRVYQLFGGTDANPSASTLLQLADALGAGPRDLMKEVSE